MARRNHETKKEWLDREVARAVNAGNPRASKNATFYLIFFTRFLAL